MGLHAASKLLWSSPMEAAFSQRSKLEGKK
jgi:hypothetical protein